MYSVLYYIYTHFCICNVYYVLWYILISKQSHLAATFRNQAARAYTVKTIEFSPDGTKLAVAQSDNIVSDGLSSGDVGYFAQEDSWYTDVVTIDPQCTERGGMVILLNLRQVCHSFKIETKVWWLFFLEPVKGSETYSWKGPKTNMDSNRGDDSWDDLPSSSLFRFGQICRTRNWMTNKRPNPFPSNFLNTSQTKLYFSVSITALSTTWGSISRGGITNMRRMGWPSGYVKMTIVNGHRNTHSHFKIWICIAPVTLRFVYKLGADWKDLGLAPVDDL